MNDFTDLLKLYLKIIIHTNAIIFDTETTGLGFDDEIVELSIIDFDGKVLFDSLLKPDKMVSGEAAEVHKIYPEMLVNQPRFCHKASTISKLFNGKTVVGYNIGFDMRMLIQTASLQNVSKFYTSYVTTIDAMQLASMFINELGPYGTPRWFKLREIIDIFEIDISDKFHRALADAQATRLLILELCSKLEIQT